MAVDQPKVIDIVSNDAKGEIVLTISDHLDWSDPQGHLFALQEKLNTYLAFIESGEIYEKYPEARGRKLQIKVIFHYQTTSEARAFLAQVKPIVEASGAGFRSEVFSGTPFPA